MDKEKIREVEQYLFDNFGIYPTAGQVKEINEICQKAEKDYLFPDEGCNGRDCDCVKVEKEINKDVPF